MATSGILFGKGDSVEHGSEFHMLGGKSRFGKEMSGKVGSRKGLNVLTQGTMIQFYLFMFGINGRELSRVVSGFTRKFTFVTQNASTLVLLFVLFSARCTMHLSCI